MVMVKKDTINITRLLQIDQAETACMWFKIKAEEKTFTLAAWYRQWEHPDAIKSQYTNGVDGEVARLESFKLQITRQKISPATSS